VSQAQKVDTPANQRRFKPYPAYKESGVEWLGEIPAHWEVKRLRSTLTSCQNGVWGDEPDGIHDIACVRVADFDRVSFRVDIADPTLRSIEPRVAAARGLHRGDLLLEKSGGGENQPVGAVVLYDHTVPAVCSNFVARVTVAAGYDARFLTYLHATLYALRINKRHIKQSTGIQNLDSASYLAEAMGFPPEPEQRAIAAFLDRETSRIDALVAKNEGVIELLQEQRTALITRAVTKGLDPDVPMKDSGVEWLGEIPARWEVRRVKDVASKIGSGKTPSGGAEVYVSDGVMLLRSQNVHLGALRLDDVAFIDSATDAEMAGSRVREGDVLLNITGASLGRCCVARLDDRTANVNQHVCIIRPRIGVFDPPFLAAALASRSGQAQIFTTENGISRDALNFEQISRLVLAAPPLEEQRSIAASLDRETARIDALIAKVRDALDRLKELRTALISAAVTGQIDVREEVA
jgi:type I restriction enzyme S subunit